MTKLNQKAHDHAMAKIAAGDVDYADAYPYMDSYSAREHVNQNGREAYAKWHLGTASVTDPDNDGDNDTTPDGDTDHDYFATQKYPVTADFKHVSRAMVKHAAMMAANAEHTDVMQSCAALLNKMNSTKACQTTASTKEQAFACVKKDSKNNQVFEISIFKSKDA